MGKIYNSNEAASDFDLKFQRMPHRMESTLINTTPLIFSVHSALYLSVKNETSINTNQLAHRSNRKWITKPYSQDLHINLSHEDRAASLIPPTTPLLL